MCIGTLPHEVMNRRINISLPEELLERVHRYAPWINISAAARAGIQAEISQLEAELGPAAIKAIAVAREKRR